MPDEPVSYDLVYVHADIPGGMTIREWRNHRAAERAAERQAAREARRQRSVRRRVGAATRALLVALCDARHAPAREART